ncbi:surface antigen [Plasmodium falciparum UGT5.1]|uniref:Surface antigen n=1 Tax=Plasmodium falciparum UGT5.1 TaxID=1237627 RepID=W7JRE9_PLAFA|nr:surface antigen [Plasmodium falciparum UGT5.1]
MKFHYFNILLLNIPLNILIFSSHVYDKKNACNSTTPHVPKTKTTKIPTIRLLCECELYAPPNNDYPEMKALMQNFDLQTLQRFQEYNDRMIKNRQKCKEQCDKDIQKIILKDKIEKQMVEKLTTLETKINTDDIPTCICEKSLADKMEKTCLKCAQNLGGIVAPSSGVLGGITELGISFWKPAALAAAKDAAIAEGLAAGKAAGDIAGAAEVIAGLNKVFFINHIGNTPLKSLFTAKTYTNVLNYPRIIHEQYRGLCAIGGANNNHPMCNIANTLKFYAVPGQAHVPEKLIIEGKLNEILAKAQGVANARASEVAASETAIIETAKKGAIETSCMGYQTTIIASIVAILVIVLVMVTIYLILHYRRKQKMKKKLQYIKLLKE